jgi:ABC-type multidrug transport system fused ATPase/permease subunit
LKGGKVIEEGTHKELMEKNGYYAGIFRSQLSEEELAEKEENYSGMNKKKSSLSSLKQISNHTSDIISEINQIKSEEKKDEKKVKIKRSKLWKFIKDKKLDLILGTLGGFIYGTGSPLAGLFLGYSINALSLEDTDKLKKEGLKWALLHLFLAVFSAITIFLKIWKLEGLGAVITARMRKAVFLKYLELQMGFYDIDSNSPGGLLTKLSIDTTQISPLILTIFGSVLSTSGALIAALIMGMIYDWKLSLIIFAFIPFIAMSTVLMGEYRENGRKKIKI